MHVRKDKDTSHYSVYFRGLVSFIRCWTYLTVHPIKACENRSHDPIIVRTGSLFLVADDDCWLRSLVHWTKLDWAKQKLDEQKGQQKQLFLLKQIAEKRVAWACVVGALETTGINEDTHYQALSSVSSKNTFPNVLDWSPRDREGVLSKEEGASLVIHIYPRIHLSYYWCQTLHHVTRARVITTIIVGHSRYRARMSQLRCPRDSPTEFFGEEYSREKMDSLFDIVLARRKRKNMP